MKLLQVLCLSILFTCPSYAQSKRDYTWVLGYYNFDFAEIWDTSIYGGQILRFDTSLLFPTIQTKRFPYGPATAVANDEYGNFLFLSTGCKIISKDMTVMENGDNIDSGVDNIENCYDLGGAWYIKNGTFVLPDAGNDHLYNLFYLRSIRSSPTYSMVDRLQMSTIDMQKNHGLGAVIEKNQVLLSDSLHNQIAVTRHGNGRDWWLIVPRGVGREFWRLQITPEGVTDKKLLNVLPAQPPFSIRIEFGDEPGTYYVPDEYSWEVEGTAAFSPDGSKYCVAILGLGFEIYDFDRCSGEMTFRRLIPMPSYRGTTLEETQVTSTGAAFSPNSRYLYYNNGESLFQLDVCDACIDHSEPVLIDTYDGALEESLPVNFFNMRNAPDGKIYMNSTSSTRTLHVIHEPNKKGLACHFEEQGIRFRFWNSWILNNFPNFNLYDLKDSPCDTLGINDPAYATPLALKDLKIFPNPADNQVQIYVPECSGGDVRVWNLTGQVVAEIRNFAGLELYTLNTGSWPAGMYVFEVHFQREKPILYKVVIVH
jgi:hypothetical protein